MVYYLNSFFSPGEGPHRFSIGTKGALFHALAKRVHDEVMQQRASDAALRVVSDSSLLDNPKLELKKRALEKAREQVKDAKRRKEEAKTVSLK